MNKLQLTKANPGNFIIENSIFEMVSGKIGHIDHP